MPWYDYQHDLGDAKLLKNALSDVRQAIKSVEKLHIHSKDKRLMSAALRKLKSIESLLESGYSYERARRR